MAKQDISYVRIEPPDDLGYLVRTHRKNKQLTLETFSELSQLNMQFLSDFEQGMGRPPPQPGTRYQTAIREPATGPAPEGRGRTPSPGRLPGSVESPPRLGMSVA